MASGLPLPRQWSVQFRKNVSAAGERLALSLRTAFFALKRDAAAGVDGMKWRDYEGDLDRKIEDLWDRVHRGAYRAQPSRRRYIPKPDGRQRPLAVAALEDKIVQRATTALLNAIYEEEFLGFSYGFRPGRGQHDALDALCVGIDSRKVNYRGDPTAPARLITLLGRRILNAPYTTPGWQLPVRRLGHDSLERLNYHMLDSVT